MSRQKQYSPRAVTVLDKMETKIESLDKLSDTFSDHLSNGYYNPLPPRITLQSPNSFEQPGDAMNEVPPIFQGGSQGQSSSSGSNKGQHSTPNSFIEDLDRRFPRIAISPSMLSTYSLMQANHTVMNDPLHSALYANPSRFANDQRRMRLELVSRRHSIQALPKYSTFFWDPVDQQPRVDIPYVPDDPFKPKPSNITFKEYLTEFPPSIGTNHYKGAMVWSNFGYINIRGRWVDPDSEGDVADAYNAEESGGDEAPHLPDLQSMPRMGPKVMSVEEQDEFYSGYTEEVSDEDDGEGDPRMYRITPATFARWAVGCGSGERYEEKEFARGPKLPTPDPRYEADVQSKPRPELQYDMETGSVLSGVYETDPHPQVLHTPQGVNIVRPPAVFSYSYPQTALDLDLQAFNANSRFNLNPSSRNTASTPEVFNSENGIFAIAPSPSTPQTNFQIYESTRTKIETLRTEIELSTASLFQKADAAKATGEQRIQLGREVVFLKNHIKTLPPPLSPTPSPPSSPSLTYNHDYTENPSSFAYRQSQYNSPEAEVKPVPPPPRRRTQYARYMREELTREQIAVNKTRQFEKRIDEETEEIKRDIRELEEQKRDLLGVLGVGSVSDLPGLIPRRLSSGKSLNAQFGLL